MNNLKNNSILKNPIKSLKLEKRSLHDSTEAYIS